MTVAGLRLSRRANAVSELHGEVVARDVARRRATRARSSPITNGVHAPTWQDARIRDARATPDDAVGDATRRSSASCSTRSRARTGVRLDPDVLTIGFARRAAAYKRSDLIFRDPDAHRAAARRPQLQLVFAGKAHPDDEIGRQHHRRAGRDGARAIPQAVVFVPDYDMALGRAAHARRRRVAQQPHPAARGVRHVGHEGGDERRAQLLDPRRLVARGLRARRQRLGHRRRDQRRRRSRTTRDAAALYDVLETRGAARPTPTATRWVGDDAGEHRDGVQERFSSDRMCRDYFERLYAR